LAVAGWRGPLALNSSKGSVPVVTGRRSKTTPSVPVPESLAD
jgi:hypothetical protein